MPRDDLTIDFVGTKGITMALTTDQPDCAAVLDDFTNRVANLPAEIAFMQEEIEVKDRAMEECRNIINKLDTKLQNHIREHGSLVKNPKEEAFNKTIRDNFTRCEILQAEKIELAKRAQLALDKHTINLDKQIKALQDRGEFPNDADIPSMLRPVIPQQPRHPEPSTAPMPLGPINNSATVVHTRHPNQHPMRPTPVPNQAQQMHGSGASTPVPGVAPHLNQRARETSLGASSKRQKLTGNLGPLPSGLSRPPLGPGTPKASTPASSRAGSIGPRASQKVGAKKVAPHRQGAIPPKRKPMKSSVNHLKRPRGNKNSPSSTNDSELSDAESASGDEEDEAITPPKRKDGEGDEDMDDVDDDEGGDNKKYCTCQSVSYGDMVACDNESCPYEWFHWSCVGLKSEPVGTWICPVCTKNMKRA